MKKPGLLIFTLFAAVLPAIAGDLTAEDQATIQAEILKRFTVTTKQIDVPALEKVSDGILIDARLIREDPAVTPSAHAPVAPSGSRWIL